MDKNLHIILLEDNQEDAELVMRFLKRTHPGWEFRITMEREEYMRLLEDFSPDLILSDNSMPRFSADEALEIRNHHYSSIPFIMVTGTASDEFAAGIIKMGADDYVLKDRLHRLPSAIQAALNKKRAEKEKGEAEVRSKELMDNLNAIFDNTSEGFLLMDATGRVRALNARAARYGLLIGKNEIRVGDPFFELIKEDKDSQFRDSSQRVLRGERVQYERLYQNEKGEPLWIGFSINPVKESGKITAICITGRDITERKQAELEREFDRNNLAALINNTQDMMWSIDRQFRLITFNNSFDERVNDLKNGFIMTGSNVLQTTLENEVEGGFQRYYERAFNGKTFKEIYQYKNSWSEVSFYPIHNQRKIIGAAIFSRDITARKMADEALEATLKELSNYKIALDESSIVSITNPRGIITYVNTNFCRISKYPPEELIGKNHRIINSDYHEKAFIQDLWTTISKGKIWRNEIRNLSKDGEYYWVDSTIVPFLNKNREPIQFVAINKDITAKKKIEQELVLRKVQEQKRVTRAMLAAEEKERNRLGEELHDNINQILAGTKLYLGRAGKDSEEFNERIKYPMELIDNAISEIRQLCHKLVTPTKNINLERMVKDLLDNWNRSASLNIHFNYAVKNLHLKDDLKLNLFRILQEQVNNITKYAKAQNVTIEIMEKDHGLWVRIADDGIGFDIQSERRGIGISNMNHRIESYNGKMDIHSSPGKGCSIEIAIPL